VPAGHTEQLLGEAYTEPAAHGKQRLCPGLLETVLMGHAWQAAEETAPVVLRKVPTGHGTRLLELLVPGQYWPAGHGAASPVAKGQ